MKRTITKEIKHYRPCVCRGSDPDCACGGTGQICMAIENVTIIEESRDLEDSIIDAECIIPELEDK